MNSHRTGVCYKPLKWDFYRWVWAEKLILIWRWGGKSWKPRFKGHIFCKMRIFLLYVNRLLNHEKKQPFPFFLSHLSVNVGFFCFYFLRNALQPISTFIWMQIILLPQQIRIKMQILDCISLILILSLHYSFSMHIASCRCIALTSEAVHNQWSK